MYRQGKTYFECNSNMLKRIKLGLIEHFMKVTYQLLDLFV